MKFKFCLIMILLLLTSSYTKADELISIYLNNSDSSPVRIDVSTISSIKFRTTKLIVTDDDENSRDFYFSDVIKITFNEDGASIETANASNINIYPNPVKDKLVINNAEMIYGSDICIYTTTGVLVEKHSQWNGENIDVSHLCPGVYFVNTNSTILKFVKQ